MKDRFLTILWLGPIVLIFVWLEFLLIPSMIIISLMALEIAERRPWNKWNWILSIQLVGIYFANFLSQIELLFVISVVIVNDGMALIGGKYLNFGIMRSKLFPKVSPNKTWGGMFYGLISALMISCIFNYFFSLFLSWTRLHIVALMLVLAAIAGDYLESCFKRIHGIKDSGDGMFTKDILKGHGGFFDRFDAGAMALWIYFLIVKFI